MARSSRRKKQDRAKAESRRAERSRLRARAERRQQVTDRYSRLIDPETGPAEVAELLAAELADSIVAGTMMQLRTELGAPAEETAEIARLMLASAQEPPGNGTLAVAAWAAHGAGDEDAEHRYASELLARAEAEDDAGQRLEVIRSFSVRGHPGEACELIEPYLREHPDDEVAAGVYADAATKAYGEAEPGERERAVLARFTDRSGIDALRAAIDAYLERTNWGESVRKLTAAERAELEEDYWQPTEREAFDALASELAIRAPADGEGTFGLPRADGPADTALRAFAADPHVPGKLAALASAWDERVHYGVWQLPDPVAAPGVWCTDLVTGTRRYAQFPAQALDGAPLWTVWLGALVPVDGIWRSTGNGVRLSPVEGDAVAEYAEEAALVGIQLVSGVPRDELPDPAPVRFGQAEPYCVRWELDEPEAEFVPFASAVTAELTTRLASRVWWKRAVPQHLENSDGDLLLLIDVTISVHGDMTERLLAHPDFTEEDGVDGQIVWWGERVEPLAPDDGARRWVLGRLMPGEGWIRIRVNSQRRLRRLMRILTGLGIEPRITEEKQAVPSLDFAWGPVPDTDAGGTSAPSSREWEENWLDQAVAPLNFRTPRQAAFGDDAADIFRVEALLRQLEHQAGLATIRGERGIDVAWLRDELGLGDRDV